MMTFIQKIKILLPFIFLFALFGLLYHELFYSKPNELPSALIGEPLPVFSLKTLKNSTLTSHQLRGQLILLNVWATWCYACNIEHPILMKIKNNYHIPIYGIDYKDNPDEAKKWLKSKGNPYVAIGNDATGDVAIDLGVYGTPETFIVNTQGRIIYRQIGAITQEVWDHTLYPLIKNNSSSSS